MMNNGEIRAVVVGLASSQPDVSYLQFIRDDPDGVLVVSLGAGSSNYVIRVTSQDGKESVIVKHAPPFIKNFQHLVATQERVHVDFYALRRFHTISPGHVPVPYCLDTNLHAFAMEDLGEMQNLSESLNNGAVDVGLAGRVARVVGLVHAATWRNDLSDEHWGQMRDKELRCHEYKLFRRNAGFVWSLEEYNPLNKIDGVLLTQFLRWKTEGVFDVPLEELGRRLVEVEECLVHADLYTASIMTKGDDLRILDMEFACLGPAGIDLGIFLGSYFMGYFRHLALGNQHAISQFIKAIREILGVYLSTLGPTLARHHAQDSVMRDITGFTAWTLFRFPIFSDIGFHFDLSPDTKIRCLQVALKGFQSYKEVTTVDTFMDTFISPL